MSRGKRGEYTQTGMYVKINNNLYKKIINLPSWNSNKNQTINHLISLGLAQEELSLKKTNDIRTMKILQYGK